MSKIYDSKTRAKKLKSIDPFPMHLIKKVDQPTTVVNENEIKRVDERDGGFQRASRSEYGKRIELEYGRFMEKYPLSDAQLTMARHLSSVVDGKVKGYKAPIPENPADVSLHIKELAYFLRANAVGICELPKYSVFTNSRWDGKPIELNHKYAIAILIDQDWKTADAFSGRDWISNSMSFLSYSTSGFIACTIAEYIRNMGFPARAHHAMNYQVVVPPILLQAGLGEMGRMGDCVIHPFLGPRFKAAIITTDLPLAIDKPIDFGLQKFCDTCGKCARECPSQAISHGDKVMHNGYEKWPIDVKRCTTMRVGNHLGSGCGTCIKACPWNKPFTPLHRFVNWNIRNFPSTHNLCIKADDWFGYGKENSKNKWWWDFEDMEDRFEIRNKNKTGKPVNELLEMMKK
jgi:reductive dehalogenase